MPCSHAKAVQGPTETRINLVCLHFVRVVFGDFGHAATASGIAAASAAAASAAAAAAAAAAESRILLLLMLSVIGEEAARHTLLDGEHFHI